MEVKEKKETQEEKIQKSHRGYRGIFSFAFRMLVTVIISFVLLTSLSYFVIRHFVIVPEYSVPNVIGLTPEKALQKLTNKKFSMTFDKHDYSRILEEGRIIAQYPTGGVSAKTGSPVRVVISKGSPLVNVPDLRGDTEVSAGIKIRAADLKVGHISRKYDSRIKKDAVISQDPMPRTGTLRNYPVKLLISSGPAPKKYLMPSLENHTLAEARTKLEFLGFTISEIKKADTSFPRNRVLSHIPPAGGILKKNSKISITVSSGMGVDF
jgi:eukaryotic-like serine/threonine-protein kinase